MSISIDPGIELVEHVFKVLQIDERWCTRQERGFTWWEYNLAQRVWSDPVIDDDGIKVCKVHARTDVPRNFTPSKSNLDRLVLLAPFASIGGGYIIDDKSKTVQLAARTDVHAESLPWMKALFSVAASIQAADAYAKAEELASMFQCIPASSKHPKSGARGGVRR